MFHVPSPRDRRCHSFGVQHHLVLTVAHGYPILTELKAWNPSQTGPFAKSDFLCCRWLLQAAHERFFDGLSKPPSDALI